MAIKFGQTVKDRFTRQIVGVSVGRLVHSDRCDQVIVRPLTGGDVRLKLVDEWRLEVHGNLLQRFARACWQFVKSENSSTAHLQFGTVASCLGGVVTGIVVSFLRCHCQ